MALFGKKNKVNKANLYLLLDRDSHLVARGELLSDPLDPTLDVRLTEGTPAAVEAAEIVQLVSMDPSAAIFMGRLVSRRADAVTLEPLRQLGAEVRRNFRMPVTFETFVYPNGGGRASATSLDLSCGGVAFYSAHPFAPHETFQIVIPITEGGPLLLTCEVLRVVPQPNGSSLYACKFADMINDEESLVREAVFNIQLREAGARRR